MFPTSAFLRGLKRKNSKFGTISYNIDLKVSKIITNPINEINPKIKNFISHQEQFDLMSACFSAEKSAIMNKKIKIKYL